MTKVSFYVLERDEPDAGLQFACRLTEKAHADGHKLYLRTAGDDDAKRLDELLWTFRQGSFVPHARSAALEGRDDPTPVVIGTADPPDGLVDVLINLGEDVPDYFSRFERAIEIVPPSARQAARQRYKFYQDRGYPLETHKIGD